MGFGSYDESEQEQQEINTDEPDAETDPRVEFEGDMAFEPGADTDDLLTRLSEIKEDDEQE